MDYNPEYPDLGEGVAKYRRMAVKAGGLSALPRETRRAYGLAVHAAFVRRNNVRHLGLAPMNPKPNCASGTTLTGEVRGEIGAAIRAQHRAMVLRWPDQIRKARTPEQWESMYHAAMAEKRKRVKNEAIAQAHKVARERDLAREQVRRAKCERVLARFQNPALPPGDQSLAKPKHEIEW